ncbi:hypothetical protein N665_4416s0001, partial [Sinapis alba]
MELVQGGLSVHRYEAEFTRLRQYVHYGQEDEMMIIRKSLWGLSPDIRSRLEAVEFHRLSDLVERACQPSSVLQRGRGGRVFRGGRSGEPRPRTPTCFSCGQLGHVRRDFPTVEQFRPAVPSHITCFTCVEGGHYATSCPRTHTVQPVVLGVPPAGHINPPLSLPPAKRQATAGRAYALELPGPSRPPKGPISAPEVASRFDGGFTKVDLTIPVLTPGDQ